MGGGQAFARIVVIGGSLLLLANCASKVDPRYGVSASPRVVEYGQPVPKGGGTYRVGKPYMVAGQLYVPEENRNYRAEGVASWYGDDFHGRLTANGEVFDMASISAAHPTLPMPCYARVTNLRNGRSLIVRINDRGPYAANRLIDVSTQAAHLLGFQGHGTTRVRVEYVGAAPLEGSDDRVLAATLREGVPAPAPSRVMVASARPFVPDFDGRRTSDVPVPAGRPFALGERTASQRSYDPSERDGAMRPAAERSAVRAEPLGAPYPAAGAADSAPVPTYAPPHSDGIASFISGRGLY
jgi:rare lipoprotein A